MLGYYIQWRGGSKISGRANDGIGALEASVDRGEPRSKLPRLTIATGLTKHLRIPEYLYTFNKNIHILLN